MTAQELKNSILQLAVQGKLVPQDKNDEPASELLKRIQAEKAKLIKEGKIKKEKALPPITEEELPFDIPQSWEWLKLGQLCQLGEGEKMQDKKYPYLEAKYLRGRIEATILTNGEFVKKGTRLILVDGENSGEVFLATEDGYKGSTFKVLYIPEEMYISYVLMFILLNKQLLRNRKTGSAIPHLNKELFFNLLIPIPPLAEQQRIVDKIEELLPLVEEYGKTETRLKELNADFPDMLRKSILQQAVQGKLTERNPEDEPASELLKRIQTEKAQLIKDGKLKKEKPLPPITEEEIPFDIPDTWQWVRFNDITEVIGDGIHGTPIFDGKGEYYFVNGNNLVDGKVVFKENTQKVSKGEYELYKKPLNSNTVLLSINGTIGNIAYYNSEPIILGKSACYIALLSGISKEYIRIILGTKLFLDYAVSKATKTTIANVSLKAMRMFPVPLPPLEEQKRIVARVEELLALCDQLK